MRKQIFVFVFARRRLGQPAEHEATHRDLDIGGAAFDRGFVLFA